MEPAGFKGPRDAARMQHMKKATKFWLGHLKKKRQPGRSKHSWKDNVNRILQKQGKRYWLVSSISGFLPDAGQCRKFSIQGGELLA